MDAIKKIRELGLDKVSEKTFINEDDLDALLDQNFERFNKTKALGFIQILEREYGLGLGDLREACLKYYEAHPEEEVRPVFNDTVAEEPPKWKKQLPLVALALALLALLVYLFLSQSQKSPETIPVSAQNTTILKEAAQNLIQRKERNESNLSLPAVTESNLTEAPSPAEKNGTLLPDNDVDLDRAVATLFKEEKMRNSENNASTTTGEGNETNETNEANTTVAAPLPESNSSAAATPVKKPDASPKRSEKSVHKTAKQKQEDKSYTKRGLYIVPIQRAWVGILYLDTYKKRGYLIRKPLRLNTKRDMLILSGHRFIKIYANGKEVPIHARKKVRFLYKDGILREIDKKTYNSYSRGIRW